MGQRPPSDEARVSELNCPVSVRLTVEPSILRSSEAGEGSRPVSRYFSKLGSGHGYREQPTGEGDCSCSQKQPEGKPALGVFGMDRAGGVSLAGDSRCRGLDG